MAQKTLLKKKKKMDSVKWCPRRDDRGCQFPAPELPVYLTVAPKRTRRKEQHVFHFKGKINRAANKCKLVRGGKKEWKG